MAGAAQNKPHAADPTPSPQPSVIQMTLSGAFRKNANDSFQQIPQLGLEHGKWRKEVEEKGIAPSTITFGNGVSDPANRILIPTYTGNLLLDADGWKLRYNVTVSTAPASYSQAIGDLEPSTDAQYQASCTGLDNQAPSSAGFDPHAYGHERHISGGGAGVGGSAPKKHRLDNQGDDDDDDKPYYNYNNCNNYNDYNNYAPPGGNGVGGGDDGRGPGENDSAQDPDGSPNTRLACPFHKLNPERFQDCESLNLTTPDRVVQHIRRAHHFEKHPYCSTCRTEFRGPESSSERDEHVRSRTCRSATLQETGFLLQAEYDKLKRLGGGTDKQKWLRVWDRIFEGTPQPRSVYFESLDEVRRRHAHNVIPEILGSWQGQDVGQLRDALVNAIYNRPVGSQVPPQTPDQTPTTVPNGQQQQQQTPRVLPRTGANPTAGQAPAVHRANPQVGPPFGPDPMAGPAMNAPVMPHPPAGWVMNLPHGSNPAAGHPINAPVMPHPPAPAMHQNPPVGYDFGPDPTAGQGLNAPGIPPLPPQALMDSPSEFSSQMLFEQPPLAAPANNAIPTALTAPQLADQAHLNNTIEPSLHDLLGQQTPDQENSFAEPDTFGDLRYLLGEQNPYSQHAQLSFRAMLGLSDLDWGSEDGDQGGQGQTQTQAQAQA